MHHRPGVDESNRFQSVCSINDGCSDEVQLITEDGTVSVPIAAYVPEARVEMPVQLDFGFCAVKEVYLSALPVWGTTAGSVVDP